MVHRASRENTDRWLEDVYNAPDREKLEALYNRWADTYDADMFQIGYLHQPVITGLVARYVPRTGDAILDAGAGTGAIGALLTLLGYNNITGLDMSDSMLEKARARKCYAGLQKGILGEKLDFLDRTFAAVISTGTFTTGHAPASAFDELTRVLDRDGVLIFTVGTTIWEEQGFREKLAELVRLGELAPVATTPIYCPMPFSPTESGFTTRAHIYKRVG